MNARTNDKKLTASFTKVITLFCLTALVSAGVASESDDALESGFTTPPNSAKPRVWWHWMNGNVTKAGITADLEWMQRVGIGGMQVFDVSLAVPQFTNERVVWMTPEWKDAVRHAAVEAGRLDLEMSMAASAGWSETGGPAVKPAEAMKKVVWSETAVTGSARFTGVLPRPPSANSPFQDIVPAPDISIPMTRNLPGAHYPPAPPPQPAASTYYADTVVLAYRVPQREQAMAGLRPLVTTNADKVDLAPLTDGDIARNMALPYVATDGATWVQFEFAQPFFTQAVTIAAGTARLVGAPSIPDGVVQKSEDGSNWVTLTSLPGTGQPHGGFPVRTYSYQATSAKYYRVRFTPPPPNPMAAFMAALMGRSVPPFANFDIGEIEFHSTPRVHHWQEKGAFANMPEAESEVTPEAAPGDAIAPGDVVDLSAKLHADGAIEWDVPPGQWRILRLGYSLTGKKNLPASAEATGLEVDKLNRKHVESYLERYVGSLADALGANLGKSFRYLLLDSWEAGNANWTENMLAEFRARRGYDATPYLPVLTGRVVGNSEISERFLWDYRRTIADLVADNHYAVISEFLHKRGLGLYAEAMGCSLPTVGDGLQLKGRADIPMGEFWAQPPGQSDAPDHASDVREAASAAHIYGKPIVAAEAFTSMPSVMGWAQSPAYLKPQADENFAAGINRIVFHTSAHQPFVDDAHKPGMTLWAFGQHYSRNITWAEQAVAWNTYLARCSFLLQQGLFVADIACYYGEGAPVTVPFWKEMKPAIPTGYRYDHLNAEVLLTRLSVRDGRLVLPDGMSYRVLVLPDDVTRLTLPVLRKLRDLVTAGATVIAPRPVSSPSLTGYPACDTEVQAIAREVWGAIDGEAVTEHPYGLGKVVWGVPPEKVLATLNTSLDFQHTSALADAKLLWAHRQTPEADLYFVANQNARGEAIEVSFRVSGKEAELWHPDTGKIEPAAYRIENGRTIVPLHLEPAGSVFVVFRKPARNNEKAVVASASTVLATLDGTWEVSFPPNWGAPAAICLDQLSSWTTHADPGVRYFSGTAAYAQEFEVSAGWLRPGAKLTLDLGEVKEIAEITVNGQAVGGILWKTPFKADITTALRPGKNRLEIKVTNLWPNRLIGDQQSPDAPRYTFTVYRPYRKDSPLLASGLLGPVTLSATTHP